MSESTAIDKRKTTSVQLKDFDELARFCDAVAKSPDLTRWKSPGAVMLALSAGEEIGMSRSAALSNLYVVNGKVSIEGSALRGVIRSSGVLAAGTDFDVFWMLDGKLMPEGEIETIAALEKVKAKPLKSWPSDFGALVSARRDGWDKPKAASFTVTDARGAGLWDGKDVWQKYPLDMLEWRATSRWGKRYAGDVTVGGLHTTEELTSVNLGEVKTVKREPPKEVDPLMVGDEEPAVEHDEDHETPPVKESYEIGECPLCGISHRPSEICPID